MWFITGARCRTILVPVFGSASEKKVGSIVGEQFDPKEGSHFLSALSLFISVGRLTFFLPLAEKLCLSSA